MSGINGILRDTASPEEIIYAIDSAKGRRHMMPNLFKNNNFTAIFESKVHNFGIFDNFFEQKLYILEFFCSFFEQKLDILFF